MNNERSIKCQVFHEKKTIIITFNFVEFKTVNIMLLKFEMDESLLLPSYYVDGDDDLARLNFGRNYSIISIYIWYSD